MKAIMISTRPQWVELILNGIKKDEVRKGTALYKAINKLIEKQGVAPMFIYCTKGNRYLYEDTQYDESSMNWYPRHFICEKIKELKEYSLNGKVVARFNATADLLELKMIEGGLYFTTPDRDCFTPNLDLNENAQIDNWQLLSYTGEKLGTQISDIHINDLEIFDKPKELSEFYHLGASEYHKDMEDEYGRRAKIYKDCFFGIKKAPQSWCYVEVDS